MLGPDEGEVARLLADRDVVPDQAPAGTDAFDGVRHGLFDDRPQAFDRSADTGRIALEQQLGRREG